MTDPSQTSAQDSHGTHRPTRRGFLAGAAGVGVVAAATMLPVGIASAQDTAAGDAAARADHRPGGSRPQAFVGVKNGNFTVAGKTFRFGGTNTYYLHQVSHYMIDAALNDAAAMSLSVVRAWAFADGRNVDRPLQPQPFTYDDAAFDSLDYAIHKAGQLGLRLVLALTNNWPDYGGMPQYVSWFFPELPNDVNSDSPVNHDKFYTERRIKECYRAYARYVTHRRNPYTGTTLQPGPDDHDLGTGQRAAQPERQDRRRGAVLGHRDERLRQGFGPPSVGRRW